MQRLSGVQAGHRMETGVEADAVAHKRLQATARLHSAFQYSNVVAMPGQNGTAQQSTQSGTNNYSTRHYGL